MAIGVAALVGIAGSAGSAHTQGMALTLDAGAVGVRYADSLDVTAATLSPAISFMSPVATLTAAGTYAQGGRGIWSMQGQFAGSVFTPAIGRVRAELMGNAGGSAHEDGTRTGEILARGRAHFMHAAWGVWAGGGGGRTWDGAVWRSVVLGDAGIWARPGAATLLLTAAPAVVDDTIRYTDTELAARWALHHIEIGGIVGARAGRGLPTVAGSASAWGSISATMWMDEHLALVASAGSYPVDFTQGYPGGRFISAGIHMALRRSDQRSSSARAESRHDGADATRSGVAERTSGGVAGFTVERGAGEQTTLRVRSPGASRVEIAGDFTNWDAVPLARAADGWWTVTLPIGTGTHQMNVRLDGEAWVVPPGLTTIRDESGTSGLLVISR